MFASLVFMATEKKRYHCVFVDSAFINNVWDGTDCFSDTFCTLASYANED